MPKEILIDPTFREFCVMQPDGYHVAARLTTTMAAIQETVLFLTDIRPPLSKQQIDCIERIGGSARESLSGRLSQVILGVGAAENLLGENNQSEVDSISVTRALMKQLY